MNRFFILVIALAIIAAGGTFYIRSHIQQVEAQKNAEQAAADAAEAEAARIAMEEARRKALHLETPEPVKSLYMTSWLASGVKNRQGVIDMIDTTEANAIVLDIKDADGRISFLVKDPIVADTGSPTNRIRDIGAFIQELHAKNIYVIGRISVFQDGYLPKIKPEWALTKKSDGTPWKDPKGHQYLDPGNREVWDYMIAVSKAAYDIGFDEINFDYIRYPSDGNIKDIDYKLIQADGSVKTRADVIEDFFSYLHDEMKKEYDIPISADLFGLTTSEKTDMGIGQVLERALPHFDFIAPMVYPSHYAKGEYGVANPAASPYEIVFRAMTDAKKKIDAMKADPNIPQEIKDKISFSQIRPWLQDFDMGAKYTADMIRAQTKATYDSGLTSWMMWDPANTYTKGGYELEQPQG